MANLNNISEKDLENVSGGAESMNEKTYKFHCKKCGYKWEKCTNSPKKEHGCPCCGWWFMTKKGNRNIIGKLIYKRECVEYDPKPIK